MRCGPITQTNESLIAVWTGQDCQIVSVRLARSSTVVGQRRQNTGRRRWYGYVGRRKIQSQTNGVDGAGHRRLADSHLPGTTVPFVVVTSKLKARLKCNTCTGVSIDDLSKEDTRMAYTQQIAERLNTGGDQESGCGHCLTTEPNA